MVLEGTTVTEKIFVALDVKKSVDNAKTAIVFVQILKTEFVLD